MTRKVVTNPANYSTRSTIRAWLGAIIVRRFNRPHMILTGVGAWHDHTVVIEAPTKIYHIDSVAALTGEIEGGSMLLAYTKALRILLAG